MHYSNFKILLIFILIVITGISCKKKINYDDIPYFTRENVSGETIWKRITVETDYRNYRMWPEHKGMQIGMSPHGRYHKVYINQKFLDAVPMKDRIAPYGSICVKENYDSNKELAMITVMVKIKDLNADKPEDKKSSQEESEDELKKNEWYWVKYDGKGKVTAQGQPGGCIKCHAGSNNDFITIRKLDKAIDPK